MELKVFSWAFEEKIHLELGVVVLNTRYDAVIGTGIKNNNDGFGS